MFCRFASTCVAGCQIVAGSVLLLLVVAFLPSAESQAADQAPTQTSKIPIVTLAQPGKANSVGSGVQASPLDSTNILRSFLAQGVVRQLPEAGDTVVIKHEEIAGYMPKMTMEFNVRDTNELKALAVGDRVSFRVKANETESWIEGIQKSTNQESITPLPSDPSPAAVLRSGRLKIGDPIPDADLLSEKGEWIKLSQFQGRVVAFTFLFTRCPLPDFCPKMNMNFSQARDLLLQTSGSPTNWQFLSVSFDPEFDAPGVLSRYAYSYRGQNPDRWLFASIPTTVLGSMSGGLDFRFANESGSFVHNLRTVVIDPHGRVYRQFDGNKWTAKELAASMVAAGTANLSQ